MSCLQICPLNYFQILGTLASASLSLSHKNVSLVLKLSGSVIEHPALIPFCVILCIPY